MNTISKEKFQITEEAEFLIHILDAYINGKKIEIPDAVSISDLYEISMIHNVTAIVCEVISSAGIYKDLSVLQPFINAYMAAVYQSSVQEYSIQELTERLEEDKIPYALVKGACIREIYPNPELRTMGDIDLFMSEESRIKTDRILKELGYQKEELGSNVWTYKKDRNTFEIHSKLVGGKFWNNIDYESYFETLLTKWKSLKGSSRKYLTLEDHFLYLCFHFAKHLHSTGAGIRMVMDIALYIKQYGEQMDWGYIWDEADKIELDVFIKKLLCICSRWFHTETANIIQENEIEDELLNSFADYVLSGGIFGFERDDSVRRLRKGVAEDGNNSSMAVKLRALVNLAFPDYKHMIIFMPVLKRYPWMLPVAWVKRWLMGIQNRERVKASLTNFDSNVKTAKEQSDLLRKMGL